jgi:hypothetical protein
MSSKTRDFVGHGVVRAPGTIKATPVRPWLCIFSAVVAQSVFNLVGPCSLIVPFERLVCRGEADSSSSSSSSSMHTLTLGVDRNMP